MLDKLDRLRRGFLRSRLRRNRVAGAHADRVRRGGQQDPMSIDIDDIDRQRGAERLDVRHAEDSIDSPFAAQPIAQARKQRSVVDGYREARERDLRRSTPTRQRAQCMR